MTKQDYLTSGFYAPLNLRIGSNTIGEPCISTLSTYSGPAVTFTALFDDHRICQKTQAMYGSKLDDEDRAFIKQMDARHQWRKKIYPIGVEFVNIEGPSVGDPVDPGTPGTIQETNGYGWILKHYSKLEEAGCDPAFAISEYIRSLYHVISVDKQVAKNHLDDIRSLRNQIDEKTRTAERQKKTIDSLRERLHKALEKDMAPREAEVDEPNV